MYGPFLLSTEVVVETCCSIRFLLAPGRISTDQGHMLTYPNESSSTALHIASSPSLSVQWLHMSCSSHTSCTAKHMHPRKQDYSSLKRNYVLPQHILNATWCQQSQWQQKWHFNVRYWHIWMETFLHISRLQAGPQQCHQHASVVITYMLFHSSWRCDTSTSGPLLGHTDNRGPRKGMG